LKNKPAIKYVRRHINKEKPVLFKSKDEKGEGLRNPWLVSWGGVFSVEICFSTSKDPPTPSLPHL
jgi:hypothetical protein